MPESASRAVRVFDSSAFRDMTAEHEAFPACRGGRVYSGRREYFERLYAHADGEGPALVVLGASGGGKSALLARWALKRRGAPPDELLPMHFVGASPASTDWSGMLRRFMGELTKHFDIELEIPDAPEEFRAAFANLLHMAAAKGKWNSSSTPSTSSRTARAPVSCSGCRRRCPPACASWYRRCRARLSKKLRSATGRRSPSSLCVARSASYSFTAIWPSAP